MSEIDLIMAKRVAQLEQEIAALRETLATTIVWIAQSAGSPLSPENAGTLVAMTEARRSPREQAYARQSPREAPSPYDLSRGQKGFRAWER